MRSATAQFDFVHLFRLFENFMQQTVHRALKDLSPFLCGLQLLQLEPQRRTAAQLASQTMDVGVLLRMSARVSRENVRLLRSRDGDGVDERK